MLDVLFYHGIVITMAGERVGRESLKTVRLESREIAL